VAVRSLGPDRKQFLHSCELFPNTWAPCHASRHCPGLKNGPVGVGDQNSGPKGRKFDPRPPVRAIFQSGPVLIPDPPSEIRLAVRTCQLSAASKDMYISISACRTLQHRCHEIFPRWRGSPHTHTHTHSRSSRDGAGVRKTECPPLWPWTTLPPPLRPCPSCLRCRLGQLCRRQGLLSKL